MTYVPSQQHDRNASYSSIQNQPIPTTYQTGTPNSVRHRTHYTPNGPENVGIQPRQSPKHSPSQERAVPQMQMVDPYTRNNTMKMSSFIEASENGANQPSMVECQIPLQQTTSVSSGGTGSSREVTPQSNASGSLSRPKQPNANWRANPIYGHSSVVSSHTPSSYSATPTSPNSLEVPPQPRIVNNASGSNTLSGKMNGNGTNLNFDHRDRNDSANFSLTSSNESDNQFVTSMV